MPLWPCLPGHKDLGHLAESCSQTCTCLRGRWLVFAGSRAVGRGCTGSQKEDVLHPNLTPLEQKPVALVSSTHPGVSVGKTHPFDENHGISHREGPGAAELEVAHARDGTGDIPLLRTGMWGLAACRVSPGLEQQQLCTR